MINQLFAQLQRPGNGWDPVPEAHAESNGAQEWLALDHALLDKLEQDLGGLAGKSVLDLGGGPGQYTVEFARRGAHVTWRDVSARYLAMARAKATQFGVADRVDFSLGYMDESPSALPQPFDLVFNRICWYYGFSDRGFAGIVYRLVAPGGFAFINTNNSRFHLEQLSASARVRTWLNDHLSMKIGHPYPPHGRLLRLFQRYPLLRLEADYSSPVNDRILFQKA